jgi:hypothetical protein
MSKGGVRSHPKLSKRVGYERTGAGVYGSDSKEAQTIGYKKLQYSCEIPILNGGFSTRISTSTTGTAHSVGVPPGLVTLKQALGPMHYPLTRTSQV